nr:hypothetical protein [Tanacetum cinerariifolium]
GAAVGRDLLDGLHRILVHRHGFFQVDDVDLVAMTEDERCHFRVPETGLVAEVNTGFQHFAHSNGHLILQG